MFLGKINNTRIEQDIVPAILRVPEQVGPECVALDLYQMLRIQLKDVFDAAERASQTEDAAVVAEAAGRIAEYFHDGIHPTRRCHDLIAAWIFERLVAVFDSDKRTL
jgi:hypothetical protein